MIDEYLAVLGLPQRPPSLEYLFELHRAHVSRVPYTNAQIIRGRPASIDPPAAVRQILDGNGGYCFHLNGGLSWLLRELGFAVTLHRGFVYRHGESNAQLNHLALMAHDLDSRAWFVDAGLGDGLYEPLPLVPGHYSQGPFVYGLEFTGARWRFLHDRLGSFAAMEFEPAAAVISDFAGAHKFFSTSPESSFKRFLIAQIRLPDRVPVLRGCRSVVLDPAGWDETSLESAEDFAKAYAALGLSDVDDLWEQERAGHEKWLAAL